MRIPLTPTPPPQPSPPISQPKPPKCVCGSTPAIGAGVAEGQDMTTGLALIAVIIETMSDVPHRTPNQPTPLRGFFMIARLMDRPVGTSLSICLTP